LSKGAKERAENAKAYIESKYSKLKNEEKERKEGKFVTVLNFVGRMGHA
jgi:hypothetical protein